MRAAGEVQGRRGQLRSALVQAVQDEGARKQAGTSALQPAGSREAALQTQLWTSRMHPVPMVVQQGGGQTNQDMFWEGAWVMG